MSDLTFPTRGAASQPRATTRAEWLDTIHGACQTLIRTPAEVIGSISVTAQVADSPEAAASLLELARRIAEEGELHAEGRHDGPFLTVRLRRGGLDGR